MRWFSRAWQTGELSDAEYARVREDYRQHVAALRPSLPQGLRLLEAAGGPVSVHDGRFIDLRWKVGSPGQLIVDIACWDMQNGTLVGNVWSYPALHVRLLYGDAEILAPIGREPRALALQGDVEILYGEIERVQRGRLEHRLLLWPPSAGSFEVRFDHASVVAVRFDDTSVSLIEE